MRDWLDWLQKAGVRAIKTMAQTAIGVIGTEALITQVDWWTVVSASALAGIVSLLTSLAGIPEESANYVNYDITERIGEGESDDI